MVSDPRPRGDWSRQFDSVFKPRPNLPGSRRGRILLVFALFLLAEVAFVISLLEQGQTIGIGGVLWGTWLVVCVGLTFIPRFGAATDAPGHQRIARQVGFWSLVLGLGVSALSTLAGVSLPAWWPMLVVSASVGAAAGVLGVLELPAKADRA